MVNVRGSCFELGSGARARGGVFATVVPLNGTHAATQRPGCSNAGKRKPFVIRGVSKVGPGKTVKTVWQPARMARGR